jgi:hypothetical protein
MPKSVRILRLKSRVTRWEQISAYDTQSPQGKLAVALAGWHIALLKIAAFCMFQYKSTLWYCLGWVSEQFGGRRMQGAFGQTPTP